MKKHIILAALCLTTSAKAGDNPFNQSLMLAD